MTSENVRGMYEVLHTNPSSYKLFKGFKRQSSLEKNMALFEYSAMLYNPR